MTLRAAVIGSPVSHSRSPAIFAYLAEKTGRELQYDAREILPADLEAFLAEARAGTDWVGFNVTLPHKEAVAARMDDLADTARGAGAVNVVRVEAGRLTGHNTDVIGIQNTLDEHACDVQGGDCLIFGAGGAARAVAYVLGVRGARTVYLLNRTPVAADAIAVRCASLFPQTSYIVLDPASELRLPPLRLAVNSTPLGMKGVPAPAESFTELEPLAFEKNALVFDLIYTPRDTPFLARAERRRLRTAGGLGMFVDQALATWEIWFGALADRETVRRDLRAHLAALVTGVVDARPLLLTGFMGVGKSTIGAQLATLLGWSFVDTDQAIETAAGLSVSEIFARDGEAAFRAFEKQAVAAALRPRTVIALGGGALLDPETLAAVEKAGRLVYLEAGIEALDERLKHGAARRPLLAGLNPEERRARIAEMLAAREPLYQRARVRIGTDGLGPKTIATRVMDEIRKEKP